MAGSMRPVKGRTETWELRIYLGRDPEGRVRHHHVTFHGPRRRAERELARLVAEQDSEPAAVPEERSQWGPGTTVNDAIAAWRDNGWEDLSPKTTRHYESIWRVHIKPRVITVDEGVIAAKGGGIVKAPKTRASIRRVACDKRTLATFRTLRSEQERLARACGEVLTEDAFVFSFEPGGTVPPYPDS